MLPRQHYFIFVDCKYIAYRTARHFSGGDGGGDTSGGGGFSAEEGDTETDDTDNHDMKLTNIAR